MDAKGVVSIEALLEENFKQKELRERRRREKEERERLRREALSVKKEQLMKTKGYAPRPSPASWLFVRASARRHGGGGM